MMMTKRRKAMIEPDDKIHFDADDVPEELRARKRRKRKHEEPEPKDWRPFGIEW